MAIEHIHSFLVDPPRTLPNSQKYEVLRSLAAVGCTGCFETCMSERLASATLQIVFAPDEQGQQNNECHAALLAYARVRRYVPGETSRFDCRE